MSIRPTFLVRRAAAALTLLGAALATPATAQSWRHHAGTAGYTEAGTAPYRCHVADGGRAFDRTCVGPGATGAIAASVDLASNTLHAAATLQGVPGIAHQFRALAEASFVDRLTFNGTAPHALRFEVALHGRVTDGGNSHGALDLFGWGAEPVDGIGLRNTGHAWAWDRGTFVVPLVGNVAQFGMRLGAYTTLAPPLPGECETVACLFAAADFSSTAYVERIVALDATGDEITGGLQAWTASGASYVLQGGAIVTATPEPASVALLAAGALPLVLLGRRRTRRTPRPRR